MLNFGAVDMVRTLRKELVRYGGTHDALVVLFSGHGFISPKDNRFTLGVCCEDDHPLKNQYVAMSELMSAVRDSAFGDPSKLKLFIYDACAPVSEMEMPPLSKMPHPKQDKKEEGNIFRIRSCGLNRLSYGNPKDPKPASGMSYTVAFSKELSDSVGGARGSDLNALHIATNNALKACVPCLHTEPCIEISAPTQQYLF